MSEVSFLYDVLVDSPRKSLMTLFFLIFLFEVFFIPFSFLLFSSLNIFSFHLVDLPAGLVFPQCSGSYPLSFSLLFFENVQDDCRDLY